MRLECPNCAATYDVPDALLPGRRSVRCARCATQWAYAAPEPLSAGFSVPDADLAPPPSRPEPLAPRLGRAPGAGRALRLAWAGSLVLIAAAVMLALVAHRPIGQAWPPSLRLYAVLGLSR